MPNFNLEQMAQEAISRVSYAVNANAEWQKKQMLKEFEAFRIRSELTDFLDAGWEYKNYVEGAKTEVEKIFAHLFWEKEYRNELRKNMIGISDIYRGNLG